MQALVNASSWADLPLRDRRILAYQSLSSRAPSTVAKYLSKHRKFINFLTHSSRPTKLPSDSLHSSLYLAYLSQTKHSYNVVLQAHCGIKWVHSLLPTDKNGNPADSTLSTNIVEAAKRVFKKNVRKKQPISTEVVVKICKRFASPPCTVIDLRTSLMFSLGFAGLFRANELLHLEQVISKLRRTIWKFWLENQRQTGIIKETQYTLQKLTGQRADTLCSCVSILLQVSSH